MKRNVSIIKLIAVAGTGLGFAATLLSNWAAVKEQEIMIEEQVNKVFARRGEDSE